MKKFNISGPINPEKHYYIPHRLNKEEIENLIDEQKYFILHAPRQSGKTTAIKEFVKQLNQEGLYKALYINVEAVFAVDLCNTPGTTGFDVVGSWGWSRVEVPGGLVNHPENQYVRTLTSTPSPPSKQLGR